MSNNDLSIDAIPALETNYIWAIRQHGEQKITIVDPGEATPVKNYLRSKQLTLHNILITHHHWDHTNGIDTLRAEYPDVSVYGSAINGGVAGCTTLLQENDTLPLTPVDIRCTVISIPGHTLDAIAYYATTETNAGNSAALLFSGDTLFTAGCGRVFEGTHKQMYESLMRLKQLPPDTLVYCGHEYTTANLRFAQAVEPHNTAIQKRLEQAQKNDQNDIPNVPAPLSVELATNPFLRCSEESICTAASRHCGKSLTEPVEVFATLREWKDTFR